MDIDALWVSGETERKWLEQLTCQRSPSGDEIDEFDRLYRSITMDLARVRTLNPDLEVIVEPSRILSAARGHLASTGDLPGVVIACFSTVSLPLTLYRIRWVILAMMVALTAIAGVQVHYLISHSDIINEPGTPEQLKHYVQSAPVECYHQDTNVGFGLSMWANNARIVPVGVVTGITGAYPLKILWENATSIGTSTAVVLNYGGVWHFFRFILPHGLPELTAVLISITAGLRVFWSLPVLGSMTRFQAVGQAARSAMTIAAGCAVLLVESGVLEGFVTPSDLPDAAKITLGALMTAVAWAYIPTLGLISYTHLRAHETRR